MDKIQYVGEALWIGYLCKAFILGGLSLPYFRSLVSAMLHLPELPKLMVGEGWGKLSFMLHAALILSLLGLMFYTMTHQHYEYSYVFDHVSGELPMKYILSAFWKDRRKFLLWMFWNLVIGGVLIKINDEFNTEVMAVLLLSQAWLNSMLLGIYLPFGEEIKIGSNPMMLIREVTKAPIFSNAGLSQPDQGGAESIVKITGWPSIHLLFSQLLPLL